MSENQLSDLAVVFKGGPTEHAHYMSAFMWRVYRSNCIDAGIARRNVNAFRWQAGACAALLVTFAFLGSPWWACAALVGMLALVAVAYSLSRRELARIEKRWSHLPLEVRP